MMNNNTPTFKIDQSTILFLQDQQGDYNPGIELIRYDDCWRPLIDSNAETQKTGTIRWKGQWGLPHPYGHEPGKFIRPLDLDVWGDPDSLHPYSPIDFSAELNVEPVQFSEVQGHCLRIKLADLRKADHPIRRTIKIPVGFKIPYSGSPRAFGLREMYLTPEIINRPINSPGFQNEWFYMEAELFGNVARHPMDADNNAGRFHCGAPMAVFQQQADQPWQAICGEADYGAAVQWRENEVIFYTTLYLQPGGTAEWQTCLWRQQETYPENVYLTATRPGGCFDTMNPPGLERKGVPEGPIVFININRPPASFEELRKIKPKLVILNYFYDHVSSIANMYGQWRTYEGFLMTEEKLKRIIAEIKGMGAKVGYYGTSVEQPETHKPVQEQDIVMDAWGRRFFAWEPGNWVIDAGNTDCADRLAKAEAEFARYYGLECVFIDRLDHLSVNHNPMRRGCRGNQRLENIPSVRLGMIQLNKKRVEWQRKLNPSLYIGLNNTTQWAGGVRYSDFNLLEGGMDLNPPIFYLNAPFGIVHKQHYNLFFCDFETDIVDHGIVQGPEQLKGFSFKRRAFFRDALADGITPQPYEDEIFVAPGSSFFKEWNNRELSDEGKWAFYNGKKFYGGEEWRQDEDRIARAIQVANIFAFPVDRIWGKPKGFPEQIRFSARRGIPGGYFIGVRNESEEIIRLSFEIDGILCSGTLEPGLVKVWFCECKESPLESIVF